MLCKIQQLAGSREHREAIGRYEISHPIIVDMGAAIWQSCTVSSWPTIAVIDPIGNLVYQQSGEGQSENLDDVIGVLLERHKEQGTLAKEPLSIEAVLRRLYSAPVPDNVHPDIDLYLHFNAHLFL